MPHVVVKLWPGKSGQQRKRLAEAIAKGVMDILHRRRFVDSSWCSKSAVGTFVGILVQKSAKLWVIPTIFSESSASATD